MGFPNSVVKASPADTDNPSAGAAQIRNLKLFLEDLLGIQDAVSYSAAPFAIGTAGQVTVSQQRMLLQNGSATTPSLSFSGATGTGLSYDSSLDAIAVLKSGTKLGYVGAAAYYDVTYYGASTAATAAVNTTAFNAAIVAAAAAKVALAIPVGDWNLNALAEITSAIEIFGSGRGTKLIFNTTSDAIVLHPATETQAYTFHIHDLAFDNVTNVPASFILNRGAINLRLDRLYCYDCAAIFCIDNQNGYGLKVSDCLFGTITGSGIRLQDDGAVTKYSYAVALADNDFTQISGDAISIDGTTTLNIFGGVIQGCANGVHTNYRAASQTGLSQSWGINLQGVHFESNTKNILCETAAAYTSRITMTACHQVGLAPTAPAIALGPYGRIVIVGSQQGGGNECTISGSSDARVTLVGHVESNFVQDGTFQWYDLGKYYDAASTPEWLSSGVQPNIGSLGTLTSHWSRSGHRATLEIALKAGADTTFGTGTYFFRDALLTAALPATDPTEAVGSVMMYDASGAYRVGVAYFDVDIYNSYSVAVAFDATDANGFLTSLSPWTWASGDWIRISITYRC